MVAHVELTSAWARSADLPETCWLFRTPAGWTFLTMHQEVRYGDNDEPVGGRASVASSDFAILDDLARHLENYYTASAWVELLDAGHQHDAELFRAWVPERIRRDFDSASIYNEDLALYTGYFEGRPVPAPARQLPGWHEEAVGQMAEHLAGLGFDVVDERPQVLLNDAGGNDLLGALRVRRYGWETVGAVRVDEVGEIFIRVPDPSEVEGPLWQPAPDVASAW